MNFMRIKRRVALDTNVLAYAEGLNGADMKRTALELVENWPESAVLLPAQTLGELFDLLVRKARRPLAKARKAILRWRDAFSLIETPAEVILSAADLAADHQLSIWDAVILSAAAESGCRLLLSQMDLQEGFTWNGVTVTNPFAPKKNDLLIALLADNAQWLRPQRWLRLIGILAKSCDPQKLRNPLQPGAVPFRSVWVGSSNGAGPRALGCVARLRPSFARARSVNFTRKIYTQGDVRYPLWSRGLDVSGTAGGRTVRRLCGFPAVSGQSPSF